MSAAFLLSLIVFLPALGALVLAFMPSENKEGIRLVTLGITIAVLALVVGGLMLPPDYTGGWNDGLSFDTSKAEVQNVVNLPWIPSFQIQYFLALDGISIPLVILTVFVTVLAMGASWSITKHVKAYCILFLLLETGMLGVFVSLDFFLFYVFWEVMLLPMYFLIGVWGGPRKEYAAIKFFLYTLLGSVLMLIAILMLYFGSDLRGLTDEQLVASHVVAAADSPALAVIRDSTTPVHTFNILALQQIGQSTEQFSRDLQWWCFLLLFIGFAIKVPSIPVHTWLPDAHVEAPTPISMILAGVLLKMGGYGIIRICYPICPFGGYDLMWVVCGLGVASMIYGAFAALAQKDFKRMVAYSSVSHMGYVVLGLGVWSALARNGYNPYYWDMGIKGAMFQMIGHGVSSAGMFFMVGIIYDRVHHRNLNEFGGLFGKMPYYTAMAMGLFFAALGLPGLCGFPGEVFVVLSVWKFSPLLAILSASVVILTAAYILWALQRVYLGAEYKGPHEDHITPSNFRENLIGTTLLVFAILFGIFPYQFPGGIPSVLKYMDASIDAQASALADWTRDVADAGSPASSPAAETAEATPSAPAEIALPVPVEPIHVEKAPSLEL
jgi:NADH-quinone oxidoreductase subunit M